MGVKDRSLIAGYVAAIIIWTVYIVAEGVLVEFDEPSDIELLRLLPFLPVFVLIAALVGLPFYGCSRWFLHVIRREGLLAFMLMGAIAVPVTIFDFTTMTEWLQAIDAPPTPFRDVVNVGVEFGCVGTVAGAASCMAERWIARRNVARNIGGEGV